jgi:hypothetical protein
MSSIKQVEYTLLILIICVLSIWLMEYHSKVPGILFFTCATRAQHWVPSIVEEPGGSPLVDPVSHG